MKKGFLKLVSAIASMLLFLTCSVMPQTVLAEGGNGGAEVPSTGIPAAVIPVAIIMIAAGAMAIRTLNNNEES